MSGEFLGDRIYKIDRIGMIDDLQGMKREASGYRQGNGEKKITQRREGAKEPRMDADERE